jgi:predicted O-linked N-acetylglucosamine transferase (SPINDLY family)
MDWIIGDHALLPPSLDSQFRERIWRLPRFWEAYRGDTTLPESNWSPDPQGTIWLGTFNNLAKVSSGSLRLWAAVMSRLPESKLLLKGRGASESVVRGRIQAELARHGVGADRVQFTPWTSGWAAHMKLYDRLDLALDTFPLTSGTTAYDALWMGVPLITIEGDWMGARLASTIVRGAGRPEWVVRTEAEYVEAVVRLARDVEQRMKLRASQRSMMASSVVCDAPGLARALEDAFEQMFDLWRSRAGTPEEIGAVP